MTGFTCTKCGSTHYKRNEIRTGGGFLGIFDFLVS